MFIKVLFGILIGMTLTRWAMWRRLGGRGCRGRRWQRGPWRLFHAVRTIGLDGGQRAHVKDIMVEARRLGTELHFARFDAMDDLSGALSGETFDRTRLEALLDRQQASFSRARAAVLDHLAALHASLSPEQREKLRDALGHDAGDATARGEHPYR